MTTIGDGRHDCPKVGCPQRLPRSTLACRRHWFEIPSDVRAAVSATWRSGDFIAYLDARDAAVGFLNGDNVSEAG